MTDAPERIWIQSDHIPDEVALNKWTTEPDAEEAHLFTEYVRADLSTHNAAPVMPKVKPLVWYESPDDDTDFCADALGLTYVVDCDLDGLCSWGFFRKVGREAYDETWWIDEAKAAAQADHEARILSQIEMTTVTVQEAARKWKRAREVAIADVSPATFTELSKAESALCRALAEQEGE